MNDIIDINILVLYRGPFYPKMCDPLPQIILFVFRDGVGDGQLLIVEI